MPTEDLYIEIFPIKNSLIERLHKELSAYKLIMPNGNDISAIGGKLSYRLKSNFSGHWLWGKSSSRLITDNYKNEDEIMKFIEELWSSQNDTFRNLQDIKKDIEWKGEPQDYADFVAWQLIPEILPKGILKNEEKRIGNVIVERDYEINGLVVQGQPSVSISISSHLLYNQDLSSFAANLSNPEELIGLWVNDKFSSSMKGEIKSITGKLLEHRRRLLAFKPKKQMQDIIKNSPDNEPVVHILSRHNEYDYAASALKLIVKTSYSAEILNMLNINLNQILKTLQIEPKYRAKILSDITKIIKEKDIIEHSYGTKKYPELFLNTTYESPKICIGQKQTIKPDENILYSLYKYGLYKRSADFDKRPLLIGIVNAMRCDGIGDFLSKLAEGLQKLKFKTKFIDEEKIKKITRIELEKAIHNIGANNPDIILGMFPEQVIDEDDDEVYEVFKCLTVNHGIASQVVEETTAKNKWAIGNIILGILGKTGNIPYILENPLSFTDYVVGLDIGRKRKSSRPGSINAPASARIYFNNGELLHYVIIDSQIEGETFPDKDLQNMFPVNKFKGKKVVIHRDGPFRGGEKKALKEWAKKIEAEFYLVEVIKSGSPRIYCYASENKSIKQPGKGNAFKINDNEAFLVSSLPPFNNATARPLKIITDSNLPIECAIESVLSLTYLHYGSLRPPRLPVTLHYSDKIAYLTLKGIKPNNLEGTIPYWL